MRIKGVLIFAHTELENYSNYIPRSRSFANLDSSGLQGLKKAKDWLTAIQDIDDERALMSYYDTLIARLEQIAAQLTIPVQQKHGSEIISAKAESPLAQDIQLTIRLIKDKFHVAEMHKQSELATALYDQIQDDKRAHELKMQKEEEEYERKQLALVEREQDYQLSIAKATGETQKSLAVLAKILSSIPPEWQKKFQDDVRELNISAFPNGVMDIAVTFASSSQPSGSYNPLMAIKPKYLPDNQLQFTAEHLLTHTPYEGAKLVFSYAMSPLHALAAAHLYRYLLRLNDSLPGLKTPSHHMEYKEENRLNKENNLAIGGYIMASIFYLFMETEKSWEKIQNEIKSESEQMPQSPLAAIVRLANTNGLLRLARKIDKISKLSPDISDKVPEPDIGKTVLKSIGKYAAMFFHSSNLSERHASYCYKLYSGEMKQHDNDTLKGLYQPG